MSAVSGWRLVGTEMVLDAETVEAWENHASVRAEIREEARILSLALGLPIDIVDPSDIPGRICERVQA